MKIEFYFEDYDQLEEFAKEQNATIRKLSDINVFPRTVLMIGNDKEKFLIL